MRRHSVLLLVVLALTRQLAADCVAQFSADWSESNDYTLRTHYYGSNSDPAFCPGTELYLSVDGGGYQFILGGAGATTINENFESGHACWTEGQHAFQIRVDCYKHVGSSCVRDTSANASDSITVHHGASVTATAGRVYRDSYGTLDTWIRAKAKWLDAWPSMVEVRTYNEMSKNLPTVLGNYNTVDANGNTEFGTWFDANRPFIKVRAVAFGSHRFASKTLASLLLKKFAR